jgi:subtilisin family serine protease
LQRPSDYHGTAVAGAAANGRDGIALGARIVNVKNGGPGDVFNEEKEIAGQLNIVLLRAFNGFPPEDTKVKLSALKSIAAEHKRNQKEKPKVIQEAEKGEAVPKNLSFANNDILTPI